MNAYKKKLNLLLRGSIVLSKIQVVTHHSLKFSRSKFLHRMHVQAQLTCSNTLNDSIFTQWFNNLYLWNHNQHSHSQKWTHVWLHLYVFLYFPINTCFNSLEIKRVFLSNLMGLSIKVWSFRINGCYPHEMWCKQYFFSSFSYMLNKSPHLFTFHGIPNTTFLCTFTTLFQTFSLFFFFIHLSFSLIFYMEGFHLYKTMDKGDFLRTSWFTFSLHNTPN